MLLLCYLRLKWYFYQFMNNVLNVNRRRSYIDGKAAQDWRKKFQLFIQTSLWTRQSCYKIQMRDLLRGRRKLKKRLDYLESRLSFGMFPRVCDVLEQRQQLNCWHPVQQSRVTKRRRSWPFHWSKQLFLLLSIFSSSTANILHVRFTPN